MERETIREKYSFDRTYKSCLDSRIGQEKQFKEEVEATFNPLNLGTQLTLAVATSIDALAVGISFSCSGYGTVQSLILPLAVIGLVSFIFSIAGLLLGVRFGGAVARRFKPEIIGGVILIAIGVKILLEHLLG